MSLVTPPKLRRLQEALYTKAKQEPGYRFYLLYDKVYRADFVAHAYALSKQHGGAPGVLIPKPGDGGAAAWDSDDTGPGGANRRAADLAPDL